MLKLLLLLHLGLAIALQTQAQSRFYFGLRGSILQSNQRYTDWVLAENVVRAPSIVPNIPGDWIVAIGATYATGKFRPRIGLAINTFIEFFPLKNNQLTSLVIGLGYRQKGFRTDSVFRFGKVGQALPDRSNNVFHCFSLDLAQRFYLKPIYVFVGGRCDRLISFDVHQEYQYVYKAYKKNELSFFVGLGKKITLGKKCLFIEGEINPGTQNMALRIPGLFGNTHATVLKNAACAIHLGYQF